MMMSSCALVGTYEHSAKEHLQLLLLNWLLFSVLVLHIIWGHLWKRWGYQARSVQLCRTCFFWQWLYLEMWEFNVGFV